MAPLTKNAECGTFVYSRRDNTKFILTWICDIPGCDCRGMDIITEDLQEPDHNEYRRFIDDYYVIDEMEKETVGNKLP